MSPSAGSPKRPLWRELKIYGAFFHLSLEFLIKVLPIKRRPWEMSVTPYSSKRGPYGNRCPFPEHYLAKDI
jgi:hypothetical protein